MLSGLHPALHIPPTLAPLRPASHPLHRVPVRLCEIKRSHVRRPALHSMFAARSMVGKIAARGICIGRVVGALLAYGRRLSLPSRRFPASPLPPEIPDTLFLCSRRPCSSERANAHPSGVRASGGRARPAALLNCAGFPHPSAFPPLRGSLRSPLRERANAHPSGVRASGGRARPATQARVRGI